MNSNEPKIAFIGWNPFQLIHVSTLIKKIPNSIFILENKHNSLSQFDEALLSRNDVPIKVYKSKDIHKLDNLYNVVVCQTVFTDIHKFKKAKIAMIQYGYAKEAHNYGAWRSLAEVCFTYGSYASNKVSYFCPTIEIGYLRKHEFECTKFKIKAKQKYKQHIEKDKKTVLYLPTWGEQCSIEHYLDAVLSLKDSYNVLVKIHHNTDLLSLNKSINLKKHIPNLLGANDDVLQLIAISDVVICDYSGAIFDSIFCKKTTILVNPLIPFKLKNKAYENSIEYCHRSELGHITEKPEKLRSTISTALNKDENIVPKELYQGLFFEDPEKPYEKIHKELIRIVATDKSSLSQQQLFIRNEIKKLHSITYSRLSYRTLNLISDLYSKIKNYKWL